MSDDVTDKPALPSGAQAAPKEPQETFVVSQREVAGKVFDHLVPNPLRPNSWVSLRRVSDTRKRQINDKFKVSFGEKPQNVRFGNSFEQQQLESFVDMGGWSTAPGKPLAPTAENFVEYVAQHQFVYEGGNTTVWTRCEALIDDELYGVTKNS